MAEYTNGNCTQEPRLVHLEIALGGISDTLKDVKDLLKSSIQADERIRTLQREVADLEKRVRALEASHAASKWIERIVWMLVATAVAFYLNNTKG